MIMTALNCNRANQNMKIRGTIIVIEVDRIFIISLISVLLLYILAINSIIFNITSHDARALLEQPQTLTAKRLYDSVDVVATGTITNSSAIMEDSKIWTYMEVEVGEFLKNPQLSRNLAIKSMGGTVGNIGSVVEDSPLFKEGDRVLLFLYKDSPVDKAYRISPYSGLLNNGSTSELLTELSIDNGNREK